MVKDKNGLDGRGDAVGAAAEFPQEAPALEGGHGLLAKTTDPGVGGVVAALPLLEVAPSKRDTDGPAGSLVCLVRPALEARCGERVDDPVLPGGGQVVGRAGQSR
ncbi:hypothetical protein JCM18897A_57390 [Streptomyces sp. JCM 18897]